MFEVSKRILFDMWQNSSQNDRIEEIFQLVANKLNIGHENISHETKAQWKAQIKDISHKMNSRWKKAGRRRDRFLEQNHSWLDNNAIRFEIIPPLRNFQEAVPGKSGRPHKPFSEVLHRTKKQKVKHLLSSSTEEITFAAEVALRNVGKKDAASLVKKLSLEPPSTSTKIKHLLEKQTDQKQRKYTKEEALAIFLDCRLTKQSYVNLRKSAIEAGHDLYPSYKQIQKAKMECGPPEENFFIDEAKSEVELQALMDHTAERLAHVQENVLLQYASSMKRQVLDLTLISTYGCDGSSGHSRYKQAFQNQEANDEYLFVYSVVPIKLQPKENDAINLWQNDRPSSTRHCRPIKFLFSKETTQMVTLENEKIKNQVLELNPTTIYLENKQINIHHQFHFTMVDGKLCNILTDTKSSQTCYICGATPKVMILRPNLLQSKSENYGFGLSTLHARIRTFECLLHIGYKLKEKQWQAKGKEQQEQIKIRKLEMQQRFKSEMGLDVDRPKPGFGSSNDGNTARAFFNNPEKSSDITGVDKTLIYRFSVILDAVCSGFEINLENFEKYCNNTADLYVSLYPWYYMPVTVHKLLFHSTEIIKHCVVPIGQLSEEAQEARHKDCRRFREHNTQKKSRNATNKDLLRMLLVSSDPVVATYRQKSAKPNKSLSHDVLLLLNCPELPSNVDEMNESDRLDEYDTENESE